MDAQKFDILDAHKAEGGPFTSAEEVDAYLSDVTDESKAKQNACAMRGHTLERSLPRCHKIVNTSVKPGRLLRPDEFGENLKALLGKRAGRTYISIEEYREAVTRL